MARTLARQLPRALALASISKPEGSPRAVMGRSAQVAATAGTTLAASAHSKGAAATRKRIAGICAQLVVSGIKTIRPDASGAKAGGACPAKVQGHDGVQ